MNIQKITNINVLSALKPKNINFSAKLMSNPIKDTFEREKAPQNDLKSTMWELENVKIKKNERQVPKFNESQLKRLETVIKETPDKALPVVELAKKPNLNGEFAYLIALQPVDKINQINILANVKNSDNEPKYSGKELINFSDKTNAEDLVKIAPLSKTSMSVKNIIEVSQQKNLPSMDKLANRILQLEAKSTKDIKDISFYPNKYQENNFVIKTVKNDGSAEFEHYDKDLNLLAVENISDKKGPDGNNYQIKTSKDLRNNLDSTVTLRHDEKVGRPVAVSEIRIKKDASGNEILREVIEPSSVQGVLNIKQIDKNGNAKEISSANKDEITGKITVKKDLTSFDGTNSKYLLEKEKDGSFKSSYKIVDKNGKELLNRTQSLQKVSANKLISTTNDDKYEITFNDKEIKVQGITKPDKKAVFNSDKDVSGNQKMIMNLLKQIPAAEIIKLRESVELISSVEDPLDSIYTGNMKMIEIGDNSSVLLHELGHAMDYKKVDSNNYESTISKAISQDKAVMEIYNEEKELFNKNMPDVDRHHVDYFINKESQALGEQGAISEVVAESNEILNSSLTIEPFAFRTQYLQCFFPKTIAQIATKLNED